jgi:hypothetical protein
MNKDEQNTLGRPLNAAGLGDLGDVHVFMLYGVGVNVRRCGVGSSRILI